jgi:hypothetical protein
LPEISTTDCRVTEWPPKTEDSLTGENSVLATLRCLFAVDDDERNRFNKAPNTVDFGTASDLKLRDAKQPVFSAPGRGWNWGFWHRRLDPGQNLI